MRVAHVVATEAFAGTERYVVEVANAQAGRGHDIVVVAGEPVGARLDARVTWVPGGTVARAVRSLWGLRNLDIAHGHLTYGEFAIAVTASRHHGNRLSTRHLAIPRGHGVTGPLVRRVIERGSHTQIAISQFVSDVVGAGRVPVVYSGVDNADDAGGVREREVLVAQRFEEEKATSVALEAWLRSDLPGRGWTLLMAGTGSEEAVLRRMCAEHPLGASVRFLGLVDDMPALYGRVSAVLAPTPRDALGLTVVEAMAHGLPVVAAAGGGHLETLAEGAGLLFPPGDADGAAAALDRLLDEMIRRDLGARAQARQRSLFSLEAHLDRLDEVYAGLVAARSAS